MREYLVRYKERFKAEYYQTKINYEKLHRMVVKYEAGTLKFTPDAVLSFLRAEEVYVILSQKSPPCTLEPIRFRRHAR